MIQFYRSPVQPRRSPAMFFDPAYLLFLAPALLLGMWAQTRVGSAYAEGSRVPTSSGYSGAEAAAAVLQSAGVSGVRIEEVPGRLTDHYSPGEKVLRLSPDVYEGRSAAALGIAAHEAGHAIQDATRYPLLVIRNGLVPLASLGGNLGWIIMLAGFSMAMATLVYVGIAVFGLTVLFQLVNLPVEYDASARAKKALATGGLVSPGEEAVVARVLSAAALTYVAATLSSFLTLIYFLFRAGAFGRSRN